MRTLLSAVLLIAVSAWGQSPSLVGKPHTTKDGMPLCAPSYKYASNECPTYDPDTKEWISQKESAVRRWDKDHKQKPSVLPMKQLGPGKIHDGTLFGKWDESCDAWACLGNGEIHSIHAFEAEIHAAACKHDPNEEGCGIVNTFQQSVDSRDRVIFHMTAPADVQQWGDWPPDQHVSKPGDAAVQNCDDPAGEGFNCPMLTRGIDNDSFSRALAELGYFPDHPLEIITNQHPDKAAAPVDRGDESGSRIDRGAILKSRDASDTPPCREVFGSLDCSPEREERYAKVFGTIEDDEQSQVVVLLPFEEFNKLRNLRNAVEVEERRLAEKSGANMNVNDCGNGDLRESTTLLCMQHDPYEYKGQFLLIYKAK